MKNEETINLTVADLRRAHDSVSCSTAKQVIKALKPEAFEEEIKHYREKIYASHNYRRISKLHEIDNKWMFCGLWDSESGSTGIHETPEKAIEYEEAAGLVYVFNSQQDFINWCYEKIK